MTWAAGAAALLLVAGTVAVPPGRLDTPRAAGTAPVVQVAPARGGVLRPGTPLVLDVAVTAGSSALAPGSISVALDVVPPGRTATLTDRLAHPVAGLGYLVAEGRSAGLAAGGTAHTRITVPAGTVSGTLGTTSGAHVVTASLQVSGSRIGVADTAVTWLPAGGTPHVRVATVLPITAPPTTTGLLDTATLAALTRPGGAWSAALAAALANRSVSVLLDPAVVASIRAAGDTAPRSALDFLDALHGLPNEVTPLPYADPDVALEAAGGLRRIPAPTSFSGIAAVGGGAPATPTATPTATATPAPDPGTRTLSTADLLTWPYAKNRIGWPLTGTVDSAGLALLADSGWPVSVVSSTDVRDTPARVAAGPVARSSRFRLLVSDGTASALLTGAAVDHGVAARSALASLLAVLATDGSTGEAPTVLLAVDRAVAGDRTTSAVLRALSAQGWIDQVPTGGLLASAPGTTVQLRTGGVTRQQTDRARRLVQGERAVQHLGTALQGGTTVTGPERLAFLGLMSSAWRLAPSWPWESGTTRFTDVVRKVRISRSDPINYFGGSGSVPVSIINQLPTPVTVVLRGRTSNARLRVEGAKTVTIPPEQTSQPVRLPVQSISNGEVDLTLALETTGGASIGDPYTVRITVAAGWETVGAVVFAAALLALFGTGVYRNLRRARRRLRRAT